MSKSIALRLALLSDEVDQLEHDLDAARRQNGKPLQLVGIAEIAEMAEVSPNTAASWRHRGRLPAPLAVLKQGSVWDRAEIDNWLDRHFVTLARELKA